MAEAAVEEMTAMMATAKTAMETMRVQTTERAAVDAILRGNAGRIKVKTVFLKALVIILLNGVQQKNVTISPDTVTDLFQKLRSSKANKTPWFSSVGYEP